VRNVETLRRLTPSVIGSNEVVFALVTYTLIQESTSIIKDENNVDKI